MLAEGLPVVIASARSFRQASSQLREQTREAQVLAGLAEEEAAKILILLDIARCPPKISASRIGSLIRSFYDHQARLIYAKAVYWRPTNIRQLRECVDDSRRSHFVEGLAGEYILPNWEIYQREACLYADIEASENGELRWNDPTEIPSAYFASEGLDRLIEAMDALRLFSREGLKIISDVWGSLTFVDLESATDADRLTQTMLERLIANNVPVPHAKQENVDVLYRYWQLPMYDIDFRSIEVSLDDLRDEQGRIMWAEAGH